MGGLPGRCPVATQGAGLRGLAGGTNAPAKARFKNLAEELNLTAEQKQQLKPVLQDEAQKLRNRAVKTGVTKRQKHAQLLQQIRQDALAKIKAILTPEQVEQWRKLRAEMGGRHSLKHPTTGAGALIPEAGGCGVSGREAGGAAKTVVFLRRPFETSRVHHACITLATKLPTRPPHRGFPVHPRSLCTGWGQVEWLAPRRWKARDQGPGVAAGCKCSDFNDLREPPPIPTLAVFGVRCEAMKGTYTQKTKRFRSKQRPESGPGPTPEPHPYLNRILASYPHRRFICVTQSGHNS